MSKFQTSIPVDLATIKNALPPRSFVNDVVFDGERVIVNWENDDYQTPYTFPVEWRDLNQVPAGVRHGTTPAAPKAPAQRATPKMYPAVSGQQTSSPSPQKAKPDDAAAVKKKTAK